MEKVLKRAALIMAALVVFTVLVAADPAKVSAYSGYGRIVDQGNLEKNLVGAWIWNRDYGESGRKPSRPPIMYYLYENGDAECCWWEPDGFESKLPKTAINDKWSYYSTGISINDKEYGIGRSFDIEKIYNSNGHTVIRTSYMDEAEELYAITDDAYAILSKKEGSYWKSFNYDTLSNTYGKTVPSTKIKQLKRGKKSFTVKWKKVSDVSGYQIQYSTKSKFRGAKIVDVNKASATSKKIKKLKSRKKYYVRVRAYKTDNGEKRYSKWSAKKAVRIR